MRALIYNDAATCSPSPIHPTRKLHRLERGFMQLGWDVVQDRPQHITQADLVCTWGVRKTEQAREHGLHHLIMELGFLGDRNEWSYLGFNSLNARGRSPFIPERGLEWYPDKWAVPMQYPRGRSTRALIMGQVPDDASLFDFGRNDTGQRYARWVVSIVKRMNAMGWDVMWRKHPKSGNDAIGPKLPHVTDTYGWGFEESINNADVVVGYSSNALLDAAIMGKPVIVGSDMSFAHPISSTFKEVFPTDFDMLRDVIDTAASAQWATKEIEHGQALEHLLTGFEDG